MKERIKGKEGEGGHNRGNSFDGGRKAGKTNAEKVMQRSVKEKGGSREGREKINTRLQKDGVREE